MLRVRKRINGKVKKTIVAYIVNNFDISMKLIYQKECQTIYHTHTTTIGDYKTIFYTCSLFHNLYGNIDK